MASRNYAKQLNRLVDDVVAKYGLRTFRQSWELGREVLGVVPVRSFYISAEPDYGNVAVITDDLLIDIEGDDEDENTTGSVRIQRLNAISGVELFDGPVEEVPESEEAQLVVLVYVAGSEVVDRHWVANTDKEQEYLLAFGKALVQSIAKGSVNGA